jgi:hypothetical protein
MGFARGGGRVGPEGTRAQPLADRNELDAVILAQRHTDPSPSQTEFRYMNHARKCELTNLPNGYTYDVDSIPSAAGGAAGDHRLLRADGSAHPMTFAVRPCVVGFRTPTSDGPAELDFSKQSDSVARAALAGLAT